MNHIDGKAIFEKTKNLQVLDVPLQENEASAFIRDLVEVLKYHEWRYYVLSEPIIGDTEYDLLYKKLEKAEQAFPNFVFEDSPTQRVSSDLTSDFNSVEHLRPMLSLDNSYNIEDLNDFDKRIKRVLKLPENQTLQYTVEPKFDGGSIGLIYENDLLVRAATRGNGTKGEEITANARTIHSIPQQANFSQYGVKKVELRGEVLIGQENFKILNEERIAAGKEVFANPRNAATGGLRMKNPAEAARRRMDAFIFQMGYVEMEEGKTFDIKTHFESIRFLQKLGFKVPTSEFNVCTSLDEVHDFCNQWETNRDAYAYEIDGMVIKLNDVELQEQCGSTNHHPRWAIAYKFKAKQATSVLETVEFQIGKIGSVTPVAKIRPVPIGGVIVSSVSLHNQDFITERDIRLGDTVVVERAGDVIPYISSVIKNLRNGTEQAIVFPDRCPSCATPLVRLETEAAWRCPNTTGCLEQNKQRVIFHVSKVAMDIDGLGGSLVEKFFELGYVHDISDIYNLPFDKIELLEGFGKRSVEKLKKAIEQAKQNPLHRLLHSLSVHHLGKKASKLIAQTVDTIFELETKTVEELVAIKDIGPVLAQNVVAHFSNQSNLQLLRKMEALGVNMKQTEADKPIEVLSNNEFLKGKSILFTGTLLQMTRKEAQEKALYAGANVISAVSSKLNILVVGEKAGSKLKKAQALGTVEIWTEEQFLERTNV